MITHAGVIMALRYIFDNPQPPMNFNDQRHFEIHLIVTNISFHLIEIFIACGRPGLTIGPHGTMLSHITSRLTEQFTMPVNIHIIEWSPLDSSNDKLWDMKQYEHAYLTKPNELNILDL